MKRATLLLTLLAMIAGFAVADTKKLNHGNLKKAAKTVWGMKLPQFDPKKDLSDSIFQGAAAVNIAIYHGFNCSAHPMTTLRDGRIPPPQWRLSESEVSFLMRRMVKIQSDKALEDFTEFSFEPSEIERVQQMVMFDLNNSFGARIFKPDGRVIDVDMKQTLTESDGKKGKEAVEHKIAIPGLEVGDVLDYFYYTDVYFLGNQRTSKMWTLMSEYPSASFVVEADLDPALTTEVHTYNGIGAPEREDNNMKVKLKWEYENIKGFKRPSFCEPMRQLPMMRISIADNLSQMLGYYSNRRRDGVFVNSRTQVCLPEAAEMFSLIKYEGGDMSKAEAIMKNYRAEHPDASDAEIADASYMTTRYVTLLSKEAYGPRTTCAFLKDLLEKQKMDSVSNIGLTNPRNGLDVLMLQRYTQADPMVKVGDRYYLFKDNLAMAPGELPAEYSNEHYFVFVGDRKKVLEHHFFNQGKFPKQSMSMNTAVYNVRVSVPDVDETAVAVAYDASRKGYFKALAESIVEEPDYIDYLETRLGVPQKVKSDKKFNVRKGRYDVAKLADDQRKKLELIPSADLGVETMQVDSVNITNYGFETANQAFEYSVSGKIEDAVAPAGDDIILSVGKIARMVNVTDKEREEKEREISIMTPGPSNRRVNIVIEVPEGYGVDAEALQSLERKTLEKLGVFVTQVKYDEAKSEIELTLLMRNNNSSYAPTQWESFRKVRDSADSFGESSIVFHRN